MKNYGVADQLMLFSFPEYGARCNDTTSDCDELLSDDEAVCPPDSVPSNPSVPRSPCECAPARCVQPLCRFGSTRELQRTGTNTPGYCCDVYECVQPKGNTDIGQDRKAESFVQLFRHHKLSITVCFTMGRAIHRDHD